MKPRFGHVAIILALIAGGIAAAQGRLSPQGGMFVGTVSSNTVPKGNGGTQLTNSTITDNGTTVTVGGALAVTGGITSTAVANTFGDVRGTVQTVATCGHDTTLNASTTILICNGGGVYGITGGVDGRVLFVVAGTIIDMAHEAGGSTGSNRLQLTNATAGYMYLYEVKMLLYNGSAARWRATQHVRFPFLYSDSTLDVLGNYNIGDNASDTGTIKGSVTYTGGTWTHNGNMTVGSGNVVSIGSATSFTNGNLMQTDGNVRLGDTSTDLVGIGVSPEANGPLTFASAVGNKIQLYPQSSTAQYGLGIQSNVLQIYGPTSTDRVALGYGDSDAFNEVMSVTGSTITLGTSNNDETAIRGNLNSTQSAPTPSSCGSGAAMVGTSTNNWGSFTTGSGATGCVLTFSSSFTGGTVHCGVWRKDGGAAPAWSESVSALTLSSAAASTTYAYFCGCGGSSCQ